MYVQMYIDGSTGSGRCKNSTHRAIAIGRHTFNIRPLLAASTRLAEIVIITVQFLFFPCFAGASFYTKDLITVYYKLQLRIGK